MYSVGDFRGEQKKSLREAYRASESDTPPVSPDDEANRQIARTTEKTSIEHFLFIF